MFYNLLINENHIVNNDISNDEMDKYIKNNKFFILETVYNFLNDGFDKSKYGDKINLIFLNFIHEIKDFKEKEELFIKSFNTIEDISYNYDVLDDITLYKKCFLNNKETKTTTIERIFKLGQTISNNLD